MNPQEKAPKQEDLDRDQQQQTEGGGLLGGDDNSSLTSVLGVNISGSHTNEDGETESGKLGGAIGTDTNSISND